MSLLTLLRFTSRGQMSGVSREKGGRLEENGGKAEITEQLRVPPLTTIKEEK